MPAKEITCPVCLETVKLSAPPAAGASLRCPHCRGAIRIPGEPSAPPAPRPPAADKPQPPKPAASRAASPKTPPVRVVAKPAPKRAPQQRAPGNPFADLDDEAGSEPIIRTRRSNGGGLGLVVGLLVGLLVLLGGAGAVAFVLLNPNRVSPTEVADLDSSKTPATEKEKDTGKAKGTARADTPKEATKKEGPAEKPPADEPFDPGAADAVKKAVVTIRGPLGPNLTDVVRTGFFLDNNELLVTSAQGLHLNTTGVLAPAVDVVLNPGQEKEKTVTGTVLESSEDLNVLFVRIKKPQLTFPPTNYFPVKLLPALNLRPKQTLYAVGPSDAKGAPPFSAVPLVVLSITPAKVKGTYQLRVQGKFSEAASGSPVMTGGGNVIGALSVAPDGAFVLTGETFADTVATLLKKEGLPESAQPKPLAEVRRFEGHTGPVFSVAISPDGKFAVSGGADKTVRVWDVETGKIIKTLEGHGDEVHGVAITPDGQRIVSGGHDKTVRVWDIATGREGQRLQPLGIKPEFLQKVSAVAISTDGAYAAATDEVNTWVWEMKSSKEFDHLKRPNEALAFTRDGKSLVVGGINHVWVWEDFTRNVGVVFQLSNLSRLGVKSLARAHEGDQVVVSHSGTGTPIEIWDVPRKQLIRTIRPRSKPSTTHSVAFSPDDRLVVSGDGNGFVSVWDVESGEEGRRGVGHEKPVRSVAVSADGKFALSGGDDGTLRLWSMPTSAPVVVKPKEGGLLQEFGGYNEAVAALALTPDGKQIAYGANDVRVRMGPDGKILPPEGKMIRIWNAETGKEIRAVEAKSVTALTYIDGGKSLLGSVFDQTPPPLRVWNAQTGEYVPERNFNNREERGAWWLQTSPDGKFVVSASFDKTARVLDVATGKQVQVFTHPMAPRTAVFSADGKQVVTCSLDAVVRLWDIQTGKELKKFEGHPNAVFACAMSPDGKVILSGGQDRTIRVWDAETGKQAREITGHTDSVQALAFSPDGKQILSASKDKTARVWDMETGKETQKLEGHKDEVTAVLFSPDGKKAYTGSRDGMVRSWVVAGASGVAVPPTPPMPPPTPDKSGAGEVRKLVGHKGSVVSLAFSPNGKQILSGGDDRSVRLWETETGKAVHTLTGHKGTVTCVVFSGDGSVAFSGGAEPGPSALHLWDVATGKELPLGIGQLKGVWSLAVAPNAKVLAIASNDQAIRTWDLTTGQGLKQMTGHLPGSLAIAITPDASVLVSASQDRTVRIWNAKEGTEIKKITEPGILYGVALSPDGKFFVTAGMDKVIRVYDAATGEETKKLTGHTDGILSVDVSPDGTRIVSGGRDKTVRVWDVATGKELQKFEGHTDLVRRVRFSPDGALVGSASNDATVRLWQVGK